MFKRYRQAKFNMMREALAQLDRKTNEQKLDSGMFPITQLGKPGNPVMAVALKLPLSELAPGTYRAEFKVADATGRAVMRPVMFDVE